MTLLICENKDIWFNLRRMMFEEGARVLFDTHIDGVIYGCGNRVSEKNALTAYTQFMGNAAVKYLYWGDIDRAGLNIFLSLKRSNPELSIDLFVPAYEQMLRLATGRNMPNSVDLRERMDDYSQLYLLISDPLQEPFREAIMQNKRIPQEIISYKYLKEHMR